MALGNSRSSEAVEPLGRLLSDVEPLVRAHAAWGLGAVGGDAARVALAERLAIELDSVVRLEIEAALAGRPL